MTNAVLVIGALTALAIGQCAHASEYINVPVVQEQVVDGTDNCVYDAGTMGIHPKTDDPIGCQVEFALPVDVGHTVHQISVFQSCSGDDGCDGNAFVTRALRSLAVAGTASGTTDTRFIFKQPLAISHTNFVETTRMMAQNAGSFPDSFVVIAGRAYKVTVTLVGRDAEVNGIQVIYD